MIKKISSLSPALTVRQKREHFLKCLIDGQLKEIKKALENPKACQDLDLTQAPQEWYFLLWATRAGHIPVLNYLTQVFEIKEKPDAGAQIEAIIGAISPERVEVYEYYFRLLSDIKQYDNLKSSLSTNNIENSPQKEKIRHMALSLVEKQVFESHIKTVLQPDKISAISAADSPIQIAVDNSEKKRSKQKI